MHDELEWMTRAGLSPAEALRTATINPAQFLGRADSDGSIRPGNRADLVLLAANPLQDIRNTRRIEAVLIEEGACRREIDSILAAAKSRAAQDSPPPPNP